MARTTYKKKASNFEKLEIPYGYMKNACENILPYRSNLSIDESMVGFKGRHNLKQYLPMKSTNWGFKVFLLCDSKNGYVYRFKWYAGGSEFVPYAITTSLLEGLKQKKIHLSADNWYSSVKLITDIYMNKS